jgi:hypothetical protein
MALRGLKTEVRTMRRIAKSPSGPNPRRLAATESSDGGVGRASDGNAETCSAGFEASLVMPVSKIRRV